MTKLQKNPVTALLEQEEMKQKVISAKERFKFKPFFVKYKGVKNASQVLRFLLPAVSIGTGAVFLSSVLHHIVPVYLLAICFAVGLIIVLEYLKSYLLNVSFTDIYANHSFNIAFLLAIVLAVLSAFVSLNGVRELHTQLDKSLVHLSEDQSSTKDSVRLYFDTQIQAAKTKLASVPTKPTWQASIDRANEKLIVNLSDEISLLQKDKSEALSSLASVHTQQTAASEQATGFNLSVILLIVILVECLILAANWFLIYYDFMTAQQAEVLTANQKSITLDSNNFKELVNSFVMTGGLSFANHREMREEVFAEGDDETLKVQEKPQRSFPIGFKANKPGINTMGEESQENNLDIGINTGINTSIDIDQAKYLNAYKAVVRDIEKGKTQSQILSKEYEVINLKTAQTENKAISKSTLQNIKRVLRNIKK